MRRTWEKKGLGKAAIDPHDMWPSSPEDVFSWCGFLPNWVTEYGQANHLTMTLKQHLDNCYGFGLYEMKGGKVEDDGSYTYPDDPTLHPLIQIELEGGAEFLQWEHGICAMRQSATEDWFVTRMD